MFSAYSLNNRVKAATKVALTVGTKVVGIAGNALWTNDNALLEVTGELEQAKRKVVYGEICRKENEKLLLINVDLAGELCRTRRRLEGLEWSALEADAVRGARDRFKADSDRFRAERDSLKAERDSLFAEKRLLTRDVASLKANMRQLNSQTVRLTDERDTMFAEKQALGREVASLKANEYRSKAQTNRLEASRDLLLAEKQSLATEVDRLSTQTVRLTDEKDALFAEKQAMAIELADLKAKNRTAEEERKTFEVLAKGLEEERNSSAAEKDSLKNDVKSLLDDRRGLEQSFLGKQLSLLADKRGLEEENGGLLRKIALLEGERVTLLQKEASLGDGKALLEKELDALLVEKSRLEQSSKSLSIACDDYVKHLQQRVEYLESDSTRQQQSIEELSSQKRDVEEELAIVKRQKEEREAELNNIFRVQQSLEF